MTNMDFNFYIIAKTILQNTPIQQSNNSKII